MKNTFRDLRPGDIVFILIKDKIHEAKVTKITTSQIECYLPNANNYFIGEKYFDQKSKIDIEGHVLCVSFDVANMFKYKYHRLEAYRSMQRVQSEMNNALDHLNETKEVMRKLMDDDESIDWNELTK